MNCAKDAPTIAKVLFLTSGTTSLFYSQAGQIHPYSAKINNLRPLMLKHAFLRTPPGESVVEHRIDLLHPVPNLSITHNTFHPRMSEKGSFSNLQLGLSPGWVELIFQVGDIADTGGG